MSDTITYGELSKDLDTQSQNNQEPANKRKLNLIFSIYEGPQYKINNITWDGNYVHSDEELATRLGFEKGDVFEDDKFKMSISEKVSPLPKTFFTLLLLIIPSFSFRFSSKNKVQLAAKNAIATKKPKV